MMLAMSNFSVDITAWHGHLGDRCLLTEAMRILFADQKAATHYHTTTALVQSTRGYAELKSPSRLTFLWSVQAGGLALPFKLDADGAADWAKRWLAEADYGPQPDHDGDNSKGWRVYNKPREQAYAICCVEPAWAEHGK